MTALFEAVIIPALQAAVLGGITGIGAAVALGMLMNVKYWLGYSLLAGAVVAWLTFALTLTKEVHYLEKFVEPPKKEIDTVHVMFSSPSGNEAVFLDLPFGAEKFAAVYNILAKNKEFSQATFGRLLSRTEYEKMRQVLIEKGLAEWRSDSHKEGVRLTRPGWHFVNRASLTPVKLHTQSAHREVGG